MRNYEIGGIFYDIADMLEMQDVQFKPAAYRKAARSIEESSEDIAAVYGKKGLDGLKKSFPGVGESIAEKIEELIKTGKLRYYSEIKKKFPRRIAELMEVPGLGPKRIKLLHEKLKISSIRQLEDAVRKHKISKLATFGAKSEEDIARGIELLKRGRERMLLGHALPIALEIDGRLRKLKEVRKAGICGSLRRRKETIGDVDILATAKDAKKVMDYFVSMPDVMRVLAGGETKSSVILKSGLQVDLRVVNPESYGAAMQYFTGSKEHNVALRELAIRKGFKVNEYGLFTKKGKRAAGRTEDEIYKKLGMSAPAAEMRENRGEIEAALKHRLPKLVPYGSIRGDFHTHTKASDGHNSIDEMIAAAKRLGYEYIAITDHSKSTRIAHGMDDEKMLEHIKRIRTAAKRFSGIRVFAGSEVDILSSGELDFSEEVLKKLDIVVASVHLGFKSSSEDMTRRILAALDNPYVDILGHPTGRRIGKREPYAADFRKIFRKAADRSVYLEINAHPERTDLDDVKVMEAKKLGCRFAINTDSHNANGLGLMHLGVAVARRGWLSSRDIVNTVSAGQLPKFLKRVKHD